MESRLTPVSACYKNSYGHKVINGYTVVNKLGQGSFGKVKVCTRDGVQYAVKIFNKAILRRRREFMKNDKGGGMKFHTALDDVMKEVEVMRRFTHKNVVRLVEVLDDQENDKLYLIQDLCAKGPLLHWDSTARLFNCRFAPQLTENHLRLLLRGMLLGVDYCKKHIVHYNGIAHRDIKPQNILVTVDDIVKICDFGQAMICDSTDLTSKTVGTIQFFPPECCGNTPEAFSALGADMWALGLTLYSLVFRELPFFAETFLEVMEAIQRFQLTFKRPVSREVRFFLERLLDTNPVSRAKVWELVQHPWIARQGRERTGPDSPTMVGFLRLARVVSAYIENVLSQMAPASASASRSCRNLPSSQQTTDRLTFSFAICASTSGHMCSSPSALPPSRLSSCISTCSLRTSPRPATRISTLRAGQHCTRSYTDCCCGVTSSARGLLPAHTLRWYLISRSAAGTPIARSARCGARNDLIIVHGADIAHCAWIITARSWVSA